MKSFALDVKIGLFIFIGLIILTVVTFSISDFFFKPGYYVNVTLGFANGLQPSAPVRLAGITVGEVKEASVFKDSNNQTMVRLKLWLTSDAVVEQDSQVVINTLGLIGEKYVEIVPGTPGTPLIQDGGVIKGCDSVSVEQMTKKGFEIALKLEKAVERVDDILSQIRSGQGTIGKFIYDDAVYDETEAMIKDLRANPWRLLARPRVSADTKKEEPPISRTRSNFGPS